MSRGARSISSTWHGARCNVALALALALSIVGAAGCDPWSWLPTSADPDYCDAQHACTSPGFECDLPSRSCRPTVPGSGPDSGAPGDLATAECARSLDCPAERPLCAAGRCRACAGATDDAACAERATATPYCGPRGGCIACRADSQLRDCAPAKPVCGDDGACRGCLANFECESGACLPGGTCERADNVYWVDNGGRSSADCRTGGVHDGTSRLTAFCDVQSAIDAPMSRPVIVIRGKAQESFHVDSGTFRVIGPGAFDGFLAGEFTVRSTVKGVAGVTVTPGKNAALTVEDLRFVGGAGAPGAICGAVGGSAQLTLRNVFVQGGLGDIAVDAGIGCEATIIGSDVRQSRIGVHLYGARGTISRSHITGHTQGVVQEDGNLFNQRFPSTLNMDASIVDGNSEVGIVSSGGGDCAVTNSVIARNGTPQAGRGGIAASATGQTVIDLDTFVGNNSANGAGGITCMAPSSIAVTNSIFSGNSRFFASQIGSSCVPMLVVTGVGDAKGLPFDPVFAGAADFHLVAGAQVNRDCCVDQAKLAPGASWGDHDGDGSARPKGKAVDIGAFELE